MKECQRQPRAPPRSRRRAAPSDTIRHPRRSCTKRNGHDNEDRLQKCMANWQPSPAQRRANLSELKRSDSSESIANTVPGLREDSIRPNRHGKVTRRATASVCLQCALRHLEPKKETAPLSHMIIKGAVGIYPWWALRSCCSAARRFLPLFPFPMLLEHSAFARAT